MCACVLIIDNSPAVGLLTRNTLMRMGCDVRLAIGGREGLWRLRNAPPDLVITEIFMPDVDGLEIIRQVRAGPSGLPILVMSAASPSGGPDYLALALRLGATAALQKPIRPLQLAEAVRLHLSPRRLRA